MTKELAKTMTTVNLMLNLHAYREMAQGRDPMPGHMTTRDAWAAVNVCQDELAERGVNNV